MYEHVMHFATPDLHLQCTGAAVVCTFILAHPHLWDVSIESQHQSLIVSQARLETLSAVLQCTQLLDRKGRTSIYYFFTLAIRLCTVSKHNRKQFLACSKLFVSTTVCRLLPSNAPQDVTAHQTPPTLTAKPLPKKRISHPSEAKHIMWRNIFLWSISIAPHNNIGKIEGNVLWS